MSWGTDTAVELVKVGGALAIGYAARSSVELLKSRKPIAYYVDQDTSRIYGNIPDWVSFPYFFQCDAPHLPDDPPRRGVDWWKWARDNHGIPAINSVSQVTITSRVDRNITVNNLRIQIEDYDPAPVGSIVLHPVGGAEITLRQVSVNLDPFASTATFREKGSGERRSSFTFALSKNEAAKISINATTLDATRLYKWRGLLDIVVGTKLRTLPIDDNGEPFVLHGGHGSPEHVWNGNERIWKPLGEDSL